MRWKQPTGGWPLPEIGSEDERLAGVDIAALRLELLHAASLYGVYSVLSEDGDDLVDEWLAWLHWVKGLFSEIAPDAEAGSVVDGVRMPLWLRQAIDTVEHPEQSYESDLFDDQDVRDWARDRFEILAVKVRPLELRAGEPLAEIEGFPSRVGKRLLAVVQDSLVLASVDDAEPRSQRAGAAEVLDDLIAARDEGVWEILVRTVKGRTEPVKVSRAEIRARWSEVYNAIVPTAGQAARAYGELSPDGRQLTVRETVDARQQLTAITTRLRSIHPDLDVIEAMAVRGRRIGPGYDLRPTVSVMRMMQRGFALALSEDPDRRTEAMPNDELRQFLIPVYNFLRKMQSR